LNVFKNDKGEARTMKDFVELGYDLGKLVQSKDEAYGDSCKRVGELMKILYPHGIPAIAYGHALIMVRVLDKLCRISTNPKALGENPWMDIAGYGLKGMQIAEDCKK